VYSEQEDIPNTKVFSSLTITFAQLYSVASQACVEKIQNRALIYKNFLIYATGIFWKKKHCGRKANDLDIIKTPKIGMFKNVLSYLYIGV